MKLSRFLPGFAGPASAALSGSLSVLSFNVAGLPEIINGNDVPGDKTTNTEIIGERFVEYGYDIVQVQEVPLSPSPITKQNNLLNLSLGLQLPRRPLQNSNIPLPHLDLRRRSLRLGAEHPSTLPLDRL
jgi:hypothetical protein